MFADVALAVLREDVVRSQRAAYAAGTQRNLTLQWKTFIAFCLFFHLRDVPADLRTICLYAQFLSRSFQSVAAIRNYLSGVKVLHILSGHEFTHLDSLECRMLLKGLGRLKIHHVRQAAPLTPRILAAIFCRLDFALPLHVACWAAFLIAFFSMARKSNMVPSSLARFNRRKQLCRGDILMGENGLLVSFGWSKSNQCGKRKVLIPLPCFENSVLCPVAAYRRLLLLVPARDSDPAFTFALKPRLQCVTEFRFVRVLRCMLDKAGFEAASFSGHSFRRGGATFAFRARVPGELIKLQGDWSSEAYLRYLDFSMDAKLEVGVAMRGLILAFGL